MLERTTTRSYFEDILSEEFELLTKEDLIGLEDRSTRSRTAKLNNTSSLNDIGRSTNERNMTRKTRTRRPRIPAIQSGYCAICSLPYNSVEDHIQSKKHQKLIGEDANYIALNGYVHPDVGIESLLSLSGIDAIGLDHEFSPKIRRRNMPRTRASSVVSDRVKPSPLSPTGSDHAGHHLRSRKNINYNYMTPPMLEEDSFQEKPDFEPVRQHEYKEYRELRSSTRALAKLTALPPDTEEPEVWNSGRPKRACINKKRVSADERLAADNRTFYKVEVLSNKLRPSDQAKEKETSKRLQSPKPHEEDKEKGLIVKFKKLRTAELVQLNNEATNFLFPKRDDSSEDDEDVDEDGANTTVSSEARNDSTLLLSSDTEDCKTPGNFKVEDEASMDSISSETKRKKKRRTHAEAFIMDNQKYYKFETPGSRLRYHGSYLSPVPQLKSPKSNGDCIPKVEKEEKPVVPQEPRERIAVNFDDYKFSFEIVPENQSWYNAFLRQDKGEQRYYFTNNYYWNDFIMPYQLPHLKPLDPRTCITAYKNLVTCLTESNSACNAEETCSNTTPEANVEESATSSAEIDLQDEDSKLSTTSTVSSTSTTEELKPVEAKLERNRRKGVVPANGKNPRKSPRQHASTLAILSSLIQQRKRRSRNLNVTQAQPALSVIPEEKEKVVDQPPKLLTRSPGRPKKPNYLAIASEIEEELDTALEDNLEEDLELEFCEENPIDFLDCKVQVSDILTLYEEAKSKEDEKSCRRFFNGTPGRKPGKRKKNKTGWPNKTRRPVRKIRKERDEDDSTIDSVSVNMDSYDEDSTDSIKNVKNSENKSDQTFVNNVEENCDLNSDDRVGRSELNGKVLLNNVTNNSDLQPYVCVQKLDSKITSKVISSPKRTSRRQRRMPGSPKSPRMLRKPRGRWYRER